MENNLEHIDTPTLDRNNVNNPVYIGNVQAQFPQKNISGKLVTLNSETYYKISNYDAMQPFFMSIVSDSNHWLFISSSGGLTAGRKNAEYALFPYYTDDKITESADITGSKTIVKVNSDNKTFLWEPFSNRYQGIYSIQRNLYKNTYGNKVIFEEVNEDLRLAFRYEWNSSNQYGFVKKSVLLNNSDKDINVTVLDGIQNIMPYGASEALQAIRSNLVDAYKKSELNDAGLGTYALSAIIVDRAEPSEALKSTVVWSLGLNNPTYLLSSSQIDNFRKGLDVTQEHDIKAQKGAYFTCTDHVLLPGSDKRWMTIANVNQSIVDIHSLSEQIRTSQNLYDLVQEDIEHGTKRLIELNGASDGFQHTADSLRDTRHFANTLFNIMRGGIFDNNYFIEKNDFINYIGKANKYVFKSKEALLSSLPENFTLQHLKQISAGHSEHSSDKDFRRLCIEYLPLKFSRRHGDPSRPWNKFSINTRSEIDGSKILDYEGNWRDIFQNWEALAHAYPEFIEGMIHKFLNASTFDGYNPYRVTKDGFDWETIEPHDPWSYIGYWGDHQIIYLLKFLEFIEKHYPNKLTDYFNQDLFVYANVPYKIKSYNDILKNPKDTIILDAGEEKKILRLKEEFGADGALLRDQSQSIYKVNLIEKLLATVLAKVSNFIPEGGIWMNTQRPEWNDANNALVGNGVSMVTLYYLRRFLNFFIKIIQTADDSNVRISAELKEFFNSTVSTLNNYQSILDGKVSDADRKKVMDGLGKAGSDYRNKIYGSGFSGDRDAITKNELLAFIQITQTYLEHSIKANKRHDDLYHAYNLMTVENDHEVSISYLSEMLEGQVAVLSSGYLTERESLALLDAQKNSALFRPDQYSYILYPNKELPRFDAKNNIPGNRVESSKLLSQLVSDGNTSIIEKDINGNYHFNGNFNNAESLKEALSKLPTETYKDLLNQETMLILDLFEDVFDHKSFTGRSGTFFGYEGLGSIYWHMVSKLQLAVQETCLRAIKNNESEEIIGAVT